MSKNTPKDKEKSFAGFLWKYTRRAVLTAVLIAGGVKCTDYLKDQRGLTGRTEEKITEWNLGIANREKDSPYILGPGKGKRTGPDYTKSKKEIRKEERTSKKDERKEERISKKEERRAKRETRKEERKPKYNPETPVINSMTEPCNDCESSKLEKNTSFYLKEMENILVHPTTQKEYNTLVNLYDKAGWSWRSGRKASSLNVFDGDTYLQIKDDFSQLNKVDVEKYSFTRKVKGNDPCDPVQKFKDNSKYVTLTLDEFLRIQDLK